MANRWDRAGVRARALTVRGRRGSCQEGEGLRGGGVDSKSWDEHDEISLLFQRSTGREDRKGTPTRPGNNHYNNNH